MYYLIYIAYNGAQISLKKTMITTVFYDPFCWYFQIRALIGIHTCKLGDDGLRNTFLRIHKYINHLKAKVSAPTLICYLREEYCV